MNSFAVTNTARGTAAYMSNEAFNGEYSSASDVYSFAVLCEEVVFEAVPFANELSHLQIMKAVASGRHPFEKQVSRLFQPEQDDEVEMHNIRDREATCQLITLVEKSLDIEPRNRCSFRRFSEELTSLMHSQSMQLRYGTSKFHPRVSLTSDEGVLLKPDESLHSAAESEETKPLEKLSVEDIGRVLRSLNLDDLVTSFEANKVTGYLLSVVETLSDIHNDLGVTKTLPAKLLLKVF
jgi:serine/threonine protein kinase